MADISKIKVQDAEYSIKDEEARTQIGELEDSITDLTTAVDGKFDKSGGTIAGSLTMARSDGYSSVEFRDAAGVLASMLQITGAGHQLGTHQYATDTSYRESYYLPPPSTGLTANKSYSILSTKSPVGISFGGTGSSSAAGARANLGLNIPTYTTFAQLGLTAACTTAEVFAAMPNPSIFVFQQVPSNALKITDTPNQYAVIEIYRVGNYGAARSRKISSKANDPLTTFDASLYLDGSTQTVNMLGWTQANVAYNLTKSGSTITLTGSDGTTSSVTDTAGSGTTSSTMTREFNSGSISETTYTTTSTGTAGSGTLYTQSKMYVVAIATSANAGTISSHTFDWEQIRTLAGGKDKETSFVFPINLTTNVNAVLYCKVNSDNTVTFRFSSTSGPVIRNVCGYY